MNKQQREKQYQKLQQQQQAIISSQLQEPKSNKKIKNSFVHTEKAAELKAEELSPKKMSQLKKLKEKSGSASQEPHNKMELNLKKEKTNQPMDRKQT